MRARAVGKEEQHEMRGKDVFEATLGHHRGKAALVLAASMLLAIPIGALLTPDPSDPSTSSPHAEQADRSTSLPEAPPANLDLVRDSLSKAAEAQGVDVEPVPVPDPASDRPLHQAVDEWLETQHAEVPDDVRKDAHEQVRQVPADLREPLARLLLAHAEATSLQREALEPLSEGERERIQALAEDEAALAATLEDPPAWLEASARKVDLARSFQAAHLLVDAAEQSLPDLRGHTDDLARRSATSPTYPDAREGTPPLLQATPRTPVRELADLDDLLATLAGPSPTLHPPAAAPLSQQLAEIDAGDGSPIGELPTSLDRALGKLWLSSTASTHVLASQGPDALLEAHLLRVRAMQETAPTLEAWGQALGTSSADARQLSRPSLAAGHALDRSASLPSPDASPSRLLGFALGHPDEAPATTHAQASDPVDGLARLYEASQADPPVGWHHQTRLTLEQLDPDQRRGLAILFAGLAEARTQAAAALSDLDPQQREQLIDRRPALEAFLAGQATSQARLAKALEGLALASQVDRQQMTSAAVTAAGALEGARGLLQPTHASQQGPQDPAPATCPGEAPLSNCEKGILFRDPLGLVVVGSAHDSTHETTTEGAPLLLLDLGGNDTYRSPVADATPFRPLSIGADLGGEDLFTTSATGQGRGFAGVGLLLQAGGDTTYSLAQQGQGYGTVGGGLGALLDLGGDDTYNAQSLAQGAAQPLDSGIGALVDVEGRDTYSSSRGIGYALGATFLDLGGRDRYEVSEPAHGARLDQGVDLDDVPDRVFQSRRDNALWLDGTFTLDTGFGLDVDGDELDHDGDLFPSLVEMLADTHAGSGAQTPVDRAENVAGTGQDEDDDGSPNAVEEGAGTDPGNETEGPLSLPGRLPMAPAEARELYQTLRGEYADAPPPNGMLLDVRMPLDDRAGYECPTSLFVCLDASGPGEDTARADASTDIDVDTGIPTLLEGGIRIIIRADAEATANAELGLVGIGAPTSTTFELPYLLSVDLGGNDTYENGAGGAIPVTTDRSNDAPEGVSEGQESRTLVPTTALDLDGADTYEGSDLAHGAGGGVLVDLGDGDDTYEGNRSTQGAKGGLLFDEGGDDVYRAGHESQAAGVPSFGFASPTSVGDIQPVESTIRAAHEAVRSTTLRPSLLVDASGDDLYRAGANGQAYAGMTPGNATTARDETGTTVSGGQANETVLFAGLLDTRGSDTYEGGARTQAVTGPNGLAVLVDRRGSDSYDAGGLVSQAGIDARTLADRQDPNTTRLPGLALLADARGGDEYRVHPRESPERSRTADRDGNLTRQRMALGGGPSEATTGGIRLTAMEAVHADLETTSEDRDGDAWIDALEQVLGTDEDDASRSPTATDAKGAIGGRLLDLPRAGLAVGSVGDDTYRRDAILAVDLGGDNTYENNAGGPILDPLARDVETYPTELGTTDLDNVGELVLFQNPVTAVLDAGDGASTFHAPRSLTQGSAMFTVGTVLTAGGDNAFQAAGEPRPRADAPEGPRASLDGLLGPKEYPFTANVTWLPEADPTRERSGTIGAVHDGQSLYLSARIPDVHNDEDDTPRASVYLATFNQTPTLVDRIDVTPDRSGHVTDRHLDEDLVWQDDEEEDANATRARMGYADGGWTLELQRPLDDPYTLTFQSPQSQVESLVLDLCQPTEVVETGNFTTTKIRNLGHRVILTDPLEADDDDELHELEGNDVEEIGLQPDGAHMGFRSYRFLDTTGEVVDEVKAEGDCELFRTEDVSLAPGTPGLVFVEFEDPTTGETWRYPPTGTAEDGARSFHRDDDIDDELTGWLPIVPRTPRGDELDLQTGPRLTQASAMGGIGLVASVSTGVGNDTYEAFRQAQGYGVVHGAGLLVDLGGPDTYRIDSDGQGHARVDDDTVAHAGREGGFGLLLDHRGNDRYEARARAQGYSPDSVPDGKPQSTLEIVDPLLGGVQSRAVLADLGGYDRYELEEGSTDTLVPLPSPPDKAYRTHEGNDRVWRQDNGGLGVDTALASHGPRSTLGDTTFADVQVDAWPTASAGECPEDKPPAGQRLDWHANHSVQLAEGEICLVITVDDPIVENVPLRRIEVLLDGEREIVHDVRDPDTQVDRWPISSRRTLLTFPVDTTDIPDGLSTWRVIAYFDAPQPEDVPRRTTWGPVPPVIAEATRSLAVSNPPTVSELDPTERVVSPKPAVGEPGLQVEAKVSHDLSEDERELVGYGKTRENVPCPFDADRLCNRYTLYLDEGEMKPVRPDGTLPTIEGQSPSDPSAGNTYTHRLKAPLHLVGDHTVGVVGEEDGDTGLRLDDPGFEALARSDDDVLYAVTGTTGSVQAGDLRLSDGDLAAHAPGTLVREADPDHGDSLTTVSATVAATTSDGWQPGETLYLDLPADSTAPVVDEGDLRLVTPEVRSTAGLHNLSVVEEGDDDTGEALVTQPDLAVSEWSAADLDGSGATPTGNDTLYIDADDEGSGQAVVSAGDVRLGRTNTSTAASAELVYFHKALYSGDVTVRAGLSTASAALGDTPELARVASNQTHPLLAENYGQPQASPLETTGTEPRGDERRGFSRFWLPMDTTRRYPTEALNGEASHLELDVRTYSQAPTAEEGMAFSDSRATPSRLNLYTPARSDQVAVLNASLVGVQDNTTFRTTLVGGEERAFTWPAEDAEDGLYNLSLAAFDVDPSMKANDEEWTKRWSPHRDGPQIRVDSRAPQAEVDLPDHIGSSMLDIFGGTFEVPWTVSDPSGIEELRVYAAPRSAPEDAWELVDRVHDPDRGSVDYAFDQGEDTFRLSVVAMDEAGNVQGVDENLWPRPWPEGGRCPERVDGKPVVPWPEESDATFPDLADHCFQSRSAALKGAFRIGLREQPRHVVTVDEAKPFVNDAALELPDREGLREVRVDGRAVTGLAAGEHAVPSACVSDPGPAPVSEVTFFMIRPGPNKTTIERTHELNATDEAGCYAFENLDEWTDRSDLYSQGFWTAGFQVADRADNTARSFIGTVYLDARAPDVTEGGLQLPAGQIAVTPGQDLSADARVEDPTGIASAQLSAPAFNATGPASLDVEDGHVTGELAIDRDVPEGIYDAYLNITDALGNTRVIHRAIPVNMTPTSFAQAPNLTRLAPASEDGVPVSRVPGGFGVAFETTSPSRFRVLAGTDAASLTPVHREDGNFTTDHEATVTGLAPGTVYTVRVVAFSAGGDLARSDTFAVRTGPAFTTEINHPIPDAVLGPEATITWTTTPAENTTLGSEDLSALASVRRSPGAVFRPVGGQAVDVGNASMELDLSTFPSGRNYALKVQTVAGDQRGVAMVEPLVVDTAAPSLTLEAPTGGWTNETSPTIAIRLDDALGGLPADPLVEARLDGDPVRSSPSLEGSIVSIPLHGDLDPGAHRLELVVEDRVGNRATQTLPLNVDRQPPTMRVMEAPADAARPGGRLPIEVFSRDDGRVATVEAHLGSAHVVAPNPGGLDELSLPVPEDLDPQAQLRIAVEDRAGNRATETLPVSVDDRAPRILDVKVTPGVASARVNLSASEAVRLVAATGGQLEVSPANDTHQLTVTGLQPDARHRIQLRVSDPAGHTVKRTVTIDTLPDRSPPSPPETVSVQRQADGSIAVEWLPAEDDGTIGFYRVARSAAGEPGWRSLDRTTDTRLVDAGVEPGTTYEYRVQAVDTAGKTSGARSSPQVTALATPELVEADVSPVEEGSNAYAFEVIYRHAGGQVPDVVHLVFDGSKVPMDRVDGSADEGITYRTVVEIDPHTPSGAHAYRFEARATDPPGAASLPEHGNFTGPLVSTLDDHGVSGANPVPTGVGLAGLSLLVAAWTAARRRRA